MGLILLLTSSFRNTKFLLQLRPHFPPREECPGGRSLHTVEAGPCADLQLPARPRPPGGHTQGRISGKALNSVPLDNTWRRRKKGLFSILLSSEKKIKMGVGKKMLINKRKKSEN